MKYRTASSFEADYRRLSPREKQLFKEAVAEINAAYANRGNAPLPTWPAKLRIKHVEGSKGIWEMTWNFAGPDGRATFEYVQIGNEVGILWRRIGDHTIFRNP